MLRALIVLSFLLLSPLALTGRAQAACTGTDLIAALPPAERQALESLSDQVPHSRGLMFRARQGDRIIDLVGTYHLSDPRHAALADRAAPLLAEADLLLVEAGPDEEARLQAELVRRPEVMFLTDGPTLPELLTEAEWQAVSAAMRARGLPPFIASKFRPWYMAMMLGIPPCAMDSVKRGERGLDHRLVAQARERGLAVQALEPWDTLFSLFDTLSTTDEIDVIRAALLMADRPEDMTVTLANAYFAGQPRMVWDFTLARSQTLAGLDAQAVQGQFAVMEDVLMVRRNRAWLPVLTAAAERHGRVLAAFGALHLPGADGVPALLEAEGWQIERLDR